MNLQSLLDLCLLVPFLLCHQLLLLLLHELSDPLLLQHWTAYHILVCFIDGFFLLGSCTGNSLLVLI